MGISDNYAEQLQRIEDNKPNADDADYSLAQWQADVVIARMALSYADGLADAAVVGLGYPDGFADGWPGDHYERAAELNKRIVGGLPVDADGHPVEPGMGI